MNNGPFLLGIDFPSPSAAIVVDGIAFVKWVVTVLAVKKCVDGALYQMLTEPQS